jgi:hypothetical protein
MGDHASATLCIREVPVISIRQKVPLRQLDLREEQRQDGGLADASTSTTAAAAAVFAGPST